MVLDSSDFEISGSSNFRHVLALSILGNKSVTIKDIRVNGEIKGITEYETCLLHLIDKISNGSVIRISEDGKSLFFKPGIIVAGNITHHCHEERGIGYYLEFITWLVSVFKNPLNATLEGITNHRLDPSVDAIKMSTIPLMKIFGISDGIELKIVRRGAAPLGGGCVIFTCPSISSVRSIHLTSFGKVKKIRGISYTMRVSPNIGNKLIDQTKGLLLEYIPDIFITSDHCKGSMSGLSPGFGVVLAAETTTGLYITSEYLSQPKGQAVSVDGEIVGRKACHILFEEISNGGCVDTFNQTLLLIYMSVCSSGVSKAILPSPSPYIVNLMRLLKMFFGVVFKISQGKRDNTASEDTNRRQINFIFSCVGAGIKNIYKSRV